MPPPRLKGIGYITGASTRPNSNAPMSERQQMALLIQMTATAPIDMPRSHLKKNEQKKGDLESEENEKCTEDENKEKSIMEDPNMDTKKDVITNSHIAHTSFCKRNFSDPDEDEYEDASDDSKKKRKKDCDIVKELKAVSGMKMQSRMEKNIKQTTVKATILNKTSSNIVDKEHDNKIDCDNDIECSDDFKGDTLYNGSLKVPPLKIVIPQQNCSIDTEGNVLRTGKITASKNAALPYVVSSSSESNDKETSFSCGSPHENSLKMASQYINLSEEKNVKSSEEKNLRVLRSSHRSGVAITERNSNNSSPQMQSSSPSPASCNAANESLESKISFSNIILSPLQPNQHFDQDHIVNLPSPSTSSTSSSKDIITSNVELHPRKRKIKSKSDIDCSLKINSNTEPLTVPGETQPPDFPFTNGYQMYLNIRKQIEKKWKNLYPVKPRPPQGFNNYLLTKRCYLLNGKSTASEDIYYPSTISDKMKDLFLTQEKARKDLIMRHIVEKEKLCLNVEQEIIRVHSKAARNISCQSAPFSVCSFLKDIEIYKIVSLEQDEKDKSARCRFNGRLLLSWLQDVDDKWEKIKESMVLRHHNEAESLHAVQLLDWKLALKENELLFCTFNTIDDEHVPIIHVGDDFDLLPN